MIKIKSRSGKIIHEVEAETLKEAVEKLVKSDANLYNSNLSDANLYNSDLSNANLHYANLSYADLSNANLHYANLSNANLSDTNLSNANLSYANLSDTNLSNANLSYANLSDTNLSNANLSDTNLSNANLSYANLSYVALYHTNIEFVRFPTIKMLSSFNLGALSEKLSLELMRRDAWAHPKPELFNAWGNGGECPYQNEYRFWLFDIDPKVWRKGKPQMRDSDLIIEICKEKGWKIRGY